MGNTIVTGSLIVFSDGFVWKRLSNEKAYKIWVSAENEDFELYKVRVDDESESLIESLEDLCDEGSMDWLFGSLGNENFYICQPLSFYKSQREIKKVNPLYAFKVATAYFREQGMIPVFEDANCKLIKP